MMMTASEETRRRSTRPGSRGGGPKRSRPSPRPPPLLNASTSSDEGSKSRRSQKIVAELWSLTLRELFDQLIDNLRQHVTKVAAREGDHVPLHQAGRHAAQDFISTFPKNETSTAGRQAHQARSVLGAAREVQRTRSSAAKQAQGSRRAFTSDQRIKRDEMIRRGKARRAKRDGRGEPALVISIAKKYTTRLSSWISSRRQHRPVRRSTIRYRAATNSPPYATCDPPGDHRSIADQARPIVPRAHDRDINKAEPQSPPDASGDGPQPT